MRTPCKTMVWLLLAVALAPASWARSRPVRAPHAMVVSVHALASQAGVSILQQGGNAVDAAVAVGFALAVVHPAAGNIGGGGFMLVRMADGTLHFLDYREKAPAAANADMYLDGKGNVIPEQSLVGYRASGVPGSVAGMAYALKHWGKLPLATVMAPAIKLARDGFVLTGDEAQSLHSKNLSEFPESRRIFQRDGKFYEAGETFRQPELADTLQRIAENPDDFYHGAMARQIADFEKQGGGLITADDLAAYETKERQPIHGTYRGLDVYSAPPPSSGGIALVQALNILEGYNLAKYGADSAQAMHLTIEAYRRAFFDRAEFLGDPDFAKIPVAQLLDKRYALAWRGTMMLQKSSRSGELKRPAVFNELDRYAQTHPKPRPGREPNHTTHYSVVDAQGNAVAVTTTLNTGYGSGVTVAGLGFLLNNEMDDFSSKPGVPNTYGLLQGPANAIGAGKRPLSAMTPTIVTKDGKLFLVLGSPGGPTIITTVANVLLGVVDYGMNLQEAVDSPRFHNQWMPDLTRLEPGFSPDTERILEKMGHVLKRTDEHWGDAECIEIDPKTGDRLGASDQRNNGRAIGY